MYCSTSEHWLCLDHESHLPTRPRARRVDGSEPYSKPTLITEVTLNHTNITIFQLTVEEYVAAMEMLTNDLRFNLYITLYKRILILWVILGFSLLLFILFSGSKGLILFGGGILWLIMNAFGVFACMWIKYKVSSC